MKQLVRYTFLLSFMLIGLASYSQSIVIPLDDEGFKENVYDFEKEENWVFKGDKPVIVDFYADWCGPCKRVAPILEELQKEYGDAIQVYKVNVDYAKNVAAAFKIRSIPSFLFIPAKGEPQLAKGALPKSVFTKAIKEVMGVTEEPKNK
ncbi:thioredoxin [Ancylomarina sp. 16SWW S1-10-2]|uniref:thioredoxin n=1 Tax=Ancylomarina sp. 16SWW S1-10-2 TaxID=2499681 RepID=UPI0012AE8235|nr:thioredoxin [Ancylomarina sp. 16SWW S1-10-2]MRT91389.1 thioredoxin [Ancylomarina sp. 16SWW S1-10-2]